MLKCVGYQNQVLTAKNFAMIILSLCSASTTSASTMTFIALGPAGINIITNHSMGFFGSHEVFAAMTQIKATLILYDVSRVSNVAAIVELTQAR